MPLPRPRKVEEQQPSIEKETGIIKSKLIHKHPRPFHNYEIVDSEGFIYAGTRVQHKSGGPIMCIYGFTKDPISRDDLDTKTLFYVYNRLFVNVDYKTKVSDEKLYSAVYLFYYSHLFEDISEEDFSYNGPQDTCFVLCSYYSETLSKIIYVITKIEELTLID